MPVPKKHIGDRGEEAIVTYLIEQGWQIVARQWRCRWGEIDVVAMHPQEQILAFIEVKTRQRDNWDGDGSLAITPTKQERLVHSAQAFLADHSQWQNWQCRFDVALVRRHGNTYRLTAYVESAFSETP